MWGFITLFTRTNPFKCHLSFCVVWCGVGVCVSVCVCVHMCVHVHVCVCVFRAFARFLLVFFVSQEALSLNESNQ